MTWKALETALRAIEPEVPFALAPAASDGALDQLEAVVGRKMPAAFRRAWGAHDGMRVVPFVLLEVLDTSQIAGEWGGLRDYDGSSGGLEAEPRGPVKPHWTSPDWIPFVLIGGETNHFCVDLDPAPGGTVGQIILASPKSEERTVVAPGIDAFLELIAAALREGRYEREDDELDLCEALGI